ncbi:MAG: alpha/beta hydrolase family protein [Armatimonadia bacterium]
MAERTAFESSREDGRQVSSVAFLHAYAREHAPKLAFDPEMGLEAFEGWRGLVREKLLELLSFPEVPPQPEPRMVWSQAREGYTLQRWECYPEPLCVVPFLVLVPDGCDEEHPAPGVICCPGSDWSKESLAGEAELDGSPPKNDHWPKNRQAYHYCRAGMVAVATDNPGIGEQAEPQRPERYELSVNGIWLGRHYESLSVSHRLPILQWLKAQPFVDGKRVATSGHSLGAKAALLLAVLDPEVAAVVWNDFMSSWRGRAIATNLERLSIHQYVPAMLEWMDYPDLMAALAPRPLLISEGGRTEDLQVLRRAYERQGAAEVLEVVYYPKYATPELRPLDNVPLPEGLGMYEYLEYANVDVPQHSFKETVCVPWLEERLG